MVKMDAAQLQAVCEYIKDGNTGELPPTRSYKTTGKFKKVGLAEDDK